MGTQKVIKKFELELGKELPEDLGSPISDSNSDKKAKNKEQKSKMPDKVKEKKGEKNKETVDKKEEKKEETQEKPKNKKQGKAKVRSKKYQDVYALIDHDKKYEISEALELVKKTSLTKFDGGVEIHVRMIAKTGKPEQAKGMLKYPHSTGKTVKVVILDEKVASEIEKTGKAEADIYFTTPENMPKIAKLAKILGPKGKMPNPKSGTISKDPKKTAKELAGGQVEYKTDKFGNLHQIIGKLSSDSKKLEENFKVLIGVLPKEKITSLSICATMGPSVKVQI